MAWLLTNFLAACLLPPLNGLLIAFAGFLLYRNRPFLGRWLMSGGFFLLLLLSLQVVAQGLLWPLEHTYPSLKIDALQTIQTDAIVVLAGGRYRNAPEFEGHGDVNGVTLERLRYGAFLAKNLGKPLLVTGGRPDGDGLSEAEAMQIVLQRDFAIKAHWLEQYSDNTWENAQNTARILQFHGLQRIILVTHASHMPRSVAAFEKAGLEVVAGPTGFISTQPLTPLDFLPRSRAMNRSSVALHEWIGLLWYAVR